MGSIKMQLDVVVSPPASEFDFCKHVVFIHMWGNPLGSHTCFDLSGNDFFSSEFLYSDIQTDRKRAQAQAGSKKEYLSLLHYRKYVICLLVPLVHVKRLNYLFPFITIPHQALLQVIFFCINEHLNTKFYHKKNTWSKAWWDI